MDTTEHKTFMVPNTEELQKLTELHKAMGDYTRMRILWLLMGKNTVSVIWQRKYAPRNLPFPISSVSCELFD